jgi:hypothetical protein
LEIEKTESSKLAAVLEVDVKIDDEKPIANGEPISKPIPTVEQVLYYYNGYLEDSKEEIQHLKQYMK